MYRNALTHRTISSPHSSPIILVLSLSNIFVKFRWRHPCGALNTSGYKNFAILTILYNTIYMKAATNVRAEIDS